MQKTNSEICFIIKVFTFCKHTKNHRLDNERADFCGNMNKRIAYLRLWSPLSLLFIARILRFSDQAQKYVFSKVIMLNGTFSHSMSCHFYGRLQQTDVHTRAQSGQSSPLAELRRLL
jgi:hypothetical protein